jgi:hypothetical protein
MLCRQCSCCAEKERVISKLEQVIEEINQTLQIPAAEYVPAIGEVFNIIDRYPGRIIRLKGSFCDCEEGTTRPDSEWSLTDDDLIFHGGYHKPRTPDGTITCLRCMNPLKRNSPYYES